MVKNSKNKFVVVTAFVAFIISAFLVAAVATPDWLSYSTGKVAETRFGLFKSCTGGACHNIVDDMSMNVAPSSTTCFRSGSDLTDRLNTTAGLILTGAGIAFLVLVALMLHSFGIATVTATGNSVIAVLLLLGAALGLIGVVVFGATFNSWINCGSDYCGQYEGTATQCGAGWSYIFTVVGTLVLVLTSLFVFVYTKFPNLITPTNDVVIFVSTLIAGAVVLLALGVGTHSWIVTIDTYQSMGLFKTCGKETCNAYNYDDRVSFDASCSRDGEQFGGRNIGSAVLLIVTAVANFLIFLMFAATALSDKPRPYTRSRKAVMIVILLVVLAAELTAFLLQQNQYGSFIMCGKPFCDVYTGYCSFGLSFGFALSALVLSGYLTMMHVFEYYDWCCFQERFATGREAFSIVKVFQGTRERSKAKKRAAASAPHAPTSGPGGAALPAGALAAAAARAAEADGEEMSTSVQLPEGNWEYDSVSGFYWNEELYLFYDTESRQFYDPNTDQWIVTEGQGAAAAAAAAEPVAAGEAAAEPAAAAAAAEPASDAADTA